VWWTTGVYVRICSQNYHLLTAPFACADEFESAPTEPAGPNASGWAWAAPQMMRTRGLRLKTPHRHLCQSLLRSSGLRLSPPPLRHQNQSRHMCGPLPRVRRDPRVLARSHLLQVRARHRWHLPRRVSAQYLWLLHLDQSEHCWGEQIRKGGGDGSQEGRAQAGMSRFLFFAHIF